MKTKFSVHLLLGLVLAGSVCANPVPQPEVYSQANDFSVIASGGGGQTSKSEYVDFSASGHATSDVDNSSVNAAQTTSYNVGQFRGNGMLNVHAGEYLGKRNVSVAGETSVYILFDVKVASHFQFQSSMNLNGSVFGEIKFNGSDNPGGNYSASGTLLPGLLYEIQAGMNSLTNETDGHGTWSYSLSVTPTNIMAGRFTAAQKAAFYAQVTELTELATQLTSSAQKEDGGELEQKLLEAAEGITKLAEDLSEDYEDPVDTNYTALPTVTFPPVAPLTNNARITAAEAQMYNIWLTNLSQLEGYNDAITTAVNRAQGAQFEGDAGWENAQMGAAVQFEAQAASLLDQEPLLRSNVVAQFAADGFTPINVTEDEALDFQQGIETNGLPTNILADLTILGLDATNITNFENEILTADANLMTGGFPGSFANTNLDSTQLASASGLRDASLALINEAALPNGKFRFDLPTEPGYLYTIQFNPNPVNSAEWTTIFSNNAVSALLSFTNAPPNGAAGFYRASHY